MPISLYLGLISLLAWLLGPLLAHFGIVRPMFGLLLFALAAPLGILAVLTGLWTVLKKKNRNGWIAIALGAIGFFIVFVAMRQGAGSPRINDVATDAANPPQYQFAPTIPENEGRDFTYGPELAKTVVTAYPNVQPLNVALPAQRVFQLALETARSQPEWHLTRVDPDARTIEAVAESRLFRFKDDVVIRITPDGDGSRVDMRSKSRDGKGDFGANAKRIRSFLEELAGRLGG